MKKNVLLVEAEPLVCARLRKYLEKYPYDLHWTADYKDALRIANSQPTQLLLMDLDVPQVECLEILCRITELKPEVKVVGLSERAEVPAAFLGSGLIALFEKPIDEDRLFMVMEELLNPASKPSLPFRFVARRRIQLQGNQRRNYTESNNCPAAYSGWGINE